MIQKNTPTPLEWVLKNWHLVAFLVTIIASAATWATKTTLDIQQLKHDVSIILNHLEPPDGKTDNEPSYSKAKKPHEISDLPAEFDSSR